MKKVHASGNCSETSKKDDTRSCTIMGGMLSINPPVTQHLNHALGGSQPMFHYGEQYQHHHHGAGISNMGAGGCNTTGSSSSDRPSVMKPVAPISKQLSLGLAHQSTVESATNAERLSRKQQLTAEESRNWTNNTGGHGGGHDMVYRNSEHPQIITSHPSDDSAPTPVDHIVSNQFANHYSIVAQLEEGGLLRLGDKLGVGNRSVPATPDVTPCTTPAVTPACSPQVSKKLKGT